ncbi:MAG: polysaccharide deacetylase [Lachnospiraceae bacterium]|nr:polysaccharide deacetylase [Lachnospiraceae bacterium]
MSQEAHSGRPWRVKRLKKMIVILVAAALIIPMLLSILMLFQVNRLNHQLDEMTKEVERLKKAGQSGTLKKDSTAQPAADPAGGQLHRDADASEGGAGGEAGRSGSGDGQDASYWDRAADEPKYKVYLTFDDGPSGNTDRILDVLAQYDVKATFFVTGMEGDYYIPLYQRIVNEGHTLGMHSYSHKYSEIYKSKEAFVEDLEKLQDYLYVNTGVWSRFYRFPGGSSNEVSKVSMQELADYLEQQNIYYLDWNIVSGDATKNLQSAKSLADRVLGRIGEEETEVVLMHDATGKNTTVEALSMILEALSKREDVEILPVTEDMDFGSVQHLKSGGEN